MASIKLSGVGQVQRALRKLGAALDQPVANQKIARAAKPMEDSLRSNVPVDTGNLRSRVTSGAWPNRRNLSLASAVAIEPGAEYWVPLNTVGSHAGFAEEGLRKGQAASKGAVDDAVRDLVEGAQT